MVASPSQHVQWTAFSKQLSEVQAIFPILEGQQLISNSTKGHTQTQMIYHQTKEIYIYTKVYIYICISHTHIRDMRSQFGFRLKFKMNIGNDMTEFSDTTKSTAEKN